MAVSMTYELGAVGVEATRTAMAGATLRLYGGAVPADIDAALGAAVLLAEMTLGSPAFAAVEADGVDVVCHSPNPISDPTANESGETTFFRIICTTAARQMQGTAGGSGSGADMLLTQPVLVLGAPVDIASLTLAQARK